MMAACELTSCQQICLVACIGPSAARCLRTSQCHRWRVRVAPVIAGIANSPPVRDCKRMHLYPSSPNPATLLSDSSMVLISLARSLLPNPFGTLLSCPIPRPRSEFSISPSSSTLLPLLPHVPRHACAHVHQSLRSLSPLSNGVRCGRCPPHAGPSRHTPHRLASLCSRRS